MPPKQRVSVSRQNAKDFLQQIGSPHVDRSGRNGEDIRSAYVESTGDQRSSSTVFQGQFVVIFKDRPGQHDPTRGMIRRAGEPLLHGPYDPTYRLGVGSDQRAYVERASGPVAVEGPVADALKQVLGLDGGRWADPAM